MPTPSSAGIATCVSMTTPTLPFALHSACIISIIGYCPNGFATNLLIIMHLAVLLLLHNGVANFWMLFAEYNSIVITAFALAPGVSTAAFAGIGVSLLGVLVHLARSKDHTLANGAPN
jgi:ABC-type transport system involved in multi-copper enzyme maturation permease subunit